MTLQERIGQLDWAAIGAQLDQEGYALVPELLDAGRVGVLAALCGTEAWRPQVADLQAACYPHLAPIANRWNARMGRSQRHPMTWRAFLDQDREAGQPRMPSTLSRLHTGDEQPLQHGGDGEQDFALQLVALLSAPGDDFDGGAFVMTEQRPRMQSRPIVVPLRRGDVAIIPVAQRPHAGTHGDYRVTLRHAVSRVRRGQRLGMELHFHDAMAEPWPIGGLSNPG